MCLKSILTKVLKQNKSKQSHNFSNSAELLTVILQFVSEYEKNAHILSKCFPSEVKNLNLKNSVKLIFPREA